MSTSLLYHAFGLKGVKYNSIEYKGGTLFSMQKLPPPWNVVRSVIAGKPFAVRARKNAF